ncbi:MAG TPA: AAA family ATPase, partial [Dehalococcoidia bacterium]|nr:AAA family ATPase [Dehalococcoidia bacterium]
MAQTQVAAQDELGRLLQVLPPRVAEALRHQPELDELLEVVLDLGRVPEGRFPGGDVVLDHREVSREDLDYVVQRVGDFGDDNRAGIERTLHRISAIRNRKNQVVGITCRVGRAVFGTIKIIEDLAFSGKNILLLGRPGVGKTTMLRETARVLADEAKKRVVIVDTSNEIAGDGDVPHSAIGHARRMQVATPTRQHAVMIEAVENHMPQVIIIDEMGTEEEAIAARTIAERGVQLVATAHGNTLDNLIMNPTLSDLVGGVQTVTLGDQEARYRGTQKTVLERKSPPTFDVVVEIRGWAEVAVHEDVAQVVDQWLRGFAVAPEVRRLDDSGALRRTKEAPRRSEGGPAPWGAEAPRFRGRSRPQPDAPRQETSANGANGSNGSVRALYVRVFPFG